MSVIVIAIFAVYRVSRMLTLEEGPFELCTRLRNLYQVDNWFGRGLRCPLCIGFWLSLTAAIAISPDFITGVWYWLGIAGAQAALSRALGDRYAG